MGVEDTPGRFDHVSLGQAGDHILRRELVQQQARRIQSHHIFAVLGAHGFHPVDTLDPMQARNEVVLRDIRQFRQTADLRAQTDIEDRKRSAGQQSGVDPGVGRQTRADLAERRVEQLEARDRVAAFAEGDIDFRTAAGGGRAHQIHSDHSIGGFFQRTRDRHQHLLGRQIAAVGQDDRTVELHLGEHGARDRSRQQRPENRSGNDRAQREAGVGAAQLWATVTFTRRPSESA